MQFLASLHIVLTCSFVFLLAYLLARVFTYLAHSVIHGSRRRTEGSSRSRRIESLRPQFEKLADEDADEDIAAMDLLQEEDEDTDADEEDAYQDAQVRTTVAITSNYDMGSAIFDDEIELEYDVQRDDGKQRSAINEDGMKEEGLDVTDNGAAELEYKDKENGGMRKGGAEEKEENGSKNVLADAQGSSSQKQRLPPTWSDLERMVNLSSSKHLTPPSPSVAPIPEY